MKNLEAAECTWPELSGEAGESGSTGGEWLLTGQKDRLPATGQEGAQSSRRRPGEGSDLVAQSLLKQTGDLGEDDCLVWESSRANPPAICGFV